MNNEYKLTDFVQVEKIHVLEGGEPCTFWRNALYIGIYNAHHMVIYADGTTEVLDNTRIRKVKIAAIGESHEC